MTRSILDVSWEKSPHGGDLWAALEVHLGVHLRGALPGEECARYSRGVYEGRASWNSDFGGEQFSLGRAWYTHLEQGKSHEYFAHARESNQAVERHTPGLVAWMQASIEKLTGAQAAHRRSWCGPGIHIFPAGEWVAQRGGVIHSDIEGLPEAHVDAQAPALSLVLMLQPPEEGGGLRLWDELHREDDALEPERLVGVPCETLLYEPGDLVIFDSYRLHQIQPFGGARDRISMTAHAAPFIPGRWDVWF